MGTHRQVQNKQKKEYQSDVQKLTCYMIFHKSSKWLRSAAMVQTNIVTVLEITSYVTFGKIITWGVMICKISTLSDQ